MLFVQRHFHEYYFKGGPYMPCFQIGPKRPLGDINKIDKSINALDLSDLKNLNNLKVTIQGTYVVHFENKDIPVTDTEVRHGMEVVMTRLHKLNIIDVERTFTKAAGFESSIFGLRYNFNAISEKQYVTNQNLYKFVITQLSLSLKQSSKENAEKQVKLASAMIELQLKMPTVSEVENKFGKDSLAAAITREAWAATGSLCAAVREVVVKYGLMAVLTEWIKNILFDQKALVQWHEGSRTVSSSKDRSALVTAIKGILPQYHSYMSTEISIEELERAAAKPLTSIEKAIVDIWFELQEVYPNVVLKEKELFIVLPERKLFSGEIRNILGQLQISLAMIAPQELKESNELPPGSRKDMSTREHRRLERAREFVVHLQEAIKNGVITVMPVGEKESLRALGANTFRVAVQRLIENTKTPEDIQTLERYLRIFSGVTGQLMPNSKKEGRLLKETLVKQVQLLPETWAEKFTSDQLLITLLVTTFVLPRVIAIIKKERKVLEPGNADTQRNSLDSNDHVRSLGDPSQRGKGK